MDYGLTISRSARKPLLGRTLVFALVAAFLVSALPVSAAVQKKATAKRVAKAKETWIAQRMSQSALRLTMAPGETQLFIVAFKNTGTATWKNTGPGFVSVYTYNPKYRKSVFQDAHWKNFRQPVVMKNTEAKTGELGFFEFILHAPDSPGTYEESFALAAEDRGWVDKSHFIIPITVTERIAVASPATVTPPTPPAPQTLTTVLPPNSADLQALRLTQSAPSLTLKPNEIAEFTILFKNVGLKSWQDEAVRVRDASGPLTIATDGAAAVAFRHESWASDGTPSFSRQEILPGEVSIVRFALRAPATPGQYAALFHFFANGSAAENGEFDIPITVTDDSGAIPAAAAIPITGTIAEPTIRVGLYTAESPITLVATADADVQTTEGAVLGAVPAGATATFSFTPGNGYRAEFPGGTAVVSSPLRLVPRAPAVVTIVNYLNRPKWSRTLNDNAFRGVIELERNPSGYTWVVNELTIESYLRGLAETGNGSPSEYHKSIITAARTYAYWHELYPNKHDGFTIDAYWDQVYRGYNSETRMPNFVASVEETRGVVITYQNELVVTPYFARSDGRTRSWQEVWHGAPKPWLVSVPVPADVGYRMLGHGVGMSAIGAAEMAKEGKSYPEILKYFYTGTDLKRMW